MDLLIQTVALRPYVLAFVVVYFVLALRDLGPGWTLLCSVRAFLVAWIAELASTRVGIPFGLYHYTGDTRSREPYLSNVPSSTPRRSCSWPTRPGAWGGSRCSGAGGSAWFRGWPA